MTVFSRELRQNPCLLPDCSGKTPERGYLSMPVDTGESLVLSACEKLGVTPNILFTGVFGILMSRYSNSEESLFATIYNGRNDSRLENTVCHACKDSAGLLFL